MIRHLGVAAAAVVLVSLAGCQKEAPHGATYHPAEVGKVNALGVKPVTLTHDATEQVDLALATVSQQGALTAVPYAALIYDGEGGSWVYTNPSGTTYVRAKVDIASIDGNTVLLSSGPPAGTRVVTIGAAEVYGAELNIGGGH